MSYIEPNLLRWQHPREGVLTPDEAQRETIVAWGYLKRSLSIPQEQQTPLSSVLDGLPPALQKVLLDSGMSLAEVAGVAGLVTPGQASDKDFIKALKDKLKEGKTPQEAVTAARYGGLVTEAELKDPEFLHDLLFAKDSDWAPASQGQRIFDLLEALNCAKDHIDLFEAAEGVAVPGSATHNKWFANAGVFQLAGMKDDAKEWEQIEKTLGRTLSKDERNAAIKSAKGMKDNWATLCAKANDLGLELRKGTTDVIDFKKDDLEKINFAALEGLVPDLNADRDAALKYARAKKLEKRLAKDGQPAKGATLDDLLKLAPNEIDNLLKLDPAKVRSLLDQGRSLQQLSELSPSGLDDVTRLDPDLVSWLQRICDATLSQISKLALNETGDLKDAMLAQYRPAGPQETFDDILPETIRQFDLGDGTILFETRSGQKIAVSKAGNTDLYNKVSEMLQTRMKVQIDEVRKAFGLPPTAEVDVMNLPSNVLRDKDKPEQGCMTIGELTIKNLVDTYQALIDKGEIGKDDKRAQLVRAFKASNALANGYSLLPYHEAPNGADGTYRTYPGGENDPTFQDMNPEDVEALLDEGKVGKRIGELLQDPTVQADYQAALNSSTGTLPDKQALIDKLHGALTGSAYTDALKALKAKGLSHEAEQMMKADLASLAALDPAKAAEAAQKLILNSLSVDFQSLTNDPSLIDTDTFEKAVTDSVAMAIFALRGGSALIRAGTQSIEDVIKFYNEFVKDKKSVTALSETIRQLVIDAKNKGGGNVSHISQADFDEAMAKSYVPLDQRGKLSNFFSTTQKYGLWGSIGGAAALASFGYKLSKGAWTADSSALERWGAARDIIAFLSVAGPVSKSVGWAGDYFFPPKGGDADTQRAWKALGLDRSLPEVWGKTSFLPGGLSYEEIWKSYNISGGFNATPELKPTLTNASENLSHIWEEALPEEAKAKMPNIGQRLGITALKVIGAITDLGGIADIVIGALNLKKAKDAGDVTGMVTAGLSIGGGVGLTGAGIIGTASLFAAAPTAIGVAAAPLFLVGAVLAVSAFLVTVIAAAVKRHKQLQQASNDQGAFFADLARDGLAKNDWGDRLEFLRNAWSIYGNDNPDPGKSYFEFQKAEWEHFRDTPPEDGTSLSRLDRTLHVSNERTWKPKDEDSGL